MEHSLVPVSKALDEPDQSPLWRCRGCGQTWPHPNPSLEDCPAISFFADDL